MRHWRIYNLFMTTCYMYKITIIIIIIIDDDDHRRDSSIQLVI
jgi:hypothetical protein